MFTDITVSCYRYKHLLKTPNINIKNKNININVNTNLFPDAGGAARSGLVLRHGGHPGGAGHGDGIQATPGPQGHRPGPGGAAQHLRGETETPTRRQLYANITRDSCSEKGRAAVPGESESELL